MTSALMPAFAPFDITPDRGEGAYLYTVDGRRYLDFMAGVAVNALGHCHPHMVEALTRQGRKLWHCSNQYHGEEQETAARRLVENSFADAVFFCNSGSEAIESGIKLVRRYYNVKGEPDRYRIITMVNGFHGRTLGAISAGGQDKLISSFEPALDGFDRVPFGDPDEVRKAIGPQTAGILLEPVQGDGGIIVATPAYLRELRAIADEHDLLLFLDEVQTGMGRTGKLFAHEWADVTPDIMALGKGVGAGFPIGACLSTQNVNVFQPGVHGSTVGGNPLAMAVTNAILDVMLADGFVEHAREMGDLLRQRLGALVDAYPTVLCGVRGLGLMIGVECVVENEALLRKLIDKGILAMRGGGNIIRLLPPLIIEASHVNEAIGFFDEACAEMAKEAA